MSTDRELLELAAKAAGFNSKWDQPRGSKNGWLRIEKNGRWPVWGPLTDDGDAQRLAVKLRLKVNVGTEATFVNDKVEGEMVHWAREQHSDSDPSAATRRAILRVAAEIGRAMP